MDFCEDASAATGPSFDVESGRRQDHTSVASASLYTTPSSPVDDISHTSSYDDESISLASSARSYQDRKLDSFLTRQRSTSDIDDAHSECSDMEESLEAAIEKKRKAWIKSKQKSERELRQKQRIWQMTKRRHEDDFVDLRSDASPGEYRLRNVKYLSGIDVASTNRDISEASPLSASEALEAFETPEVPPEIPVTIHRAPTNASGWTAKSAITTDIPTSTKSSNNMWKKIQGPVVDAKEALAGKLDLQNRSDVELFLMGLISIALLTLVILVSIVLFQK